MPEILPSILSCDFARLAEQIAPLEAAGCKILHVDVMDGHFVPNITMGPPVVASLRKATKAVLDVHLMIENPDNYIPEFVKAGADMISVHQEACVHLDRSLRLIRSEGARPGVVINPGTPVAVLDDVLELVDFVLVMSVNPGFGGQKFIPHSLKKVKQLVARRKDLGLQFTIELDGGVTKDNVEAIVNAGAEWMVAGSAVFGTVNPTNTWAELTRMAREANHVRV
ncbi:MAG: ribulose-phosphate 3-epimerase [Bryobacteraceae bacterium]